MCGRRREAFPPIRSATAPSSTTGHCIQILLFKLLRRYTRACAQQVPCMRPDHVGAIVGYQGGSLT